MVGLGSTPRPAFPALVGRVTNGPHGGSGAEHIEKHGIRSWAAASMDDRIGADRGAAEKSWWVDLNCQNAPSTMIGFLRWVGSINVSREMGLIPCPALLLVPDSDPARLADMREWQTKLAHSRMDVVSSTGFHIAATEQDVCAEKTLAFVLEVEAGRSRTL